MAKTQYLYINIILVIGWVICKVFMHNWVLEMFLQLSFKVTLTFAVVWEAYWVYRLETIKTGKGANFNKSQLAEDITAWQKHYKSIVYKFWDYVLFPPMLVYFMFNQQWVVFITLIAYQAIKTIVIWDIRKINDMHINSVERGDCQS